MDRMWAAIMAPLLLAACSAKEPRSEDPIANMETSCMALAASQGNPQGMEGCMDVADRMRARRFAAAQAGAAPPVKAPAVSTSTARAAPGLDIRADAFRGGQAVALTLTGPIAPGDSYRLGETIAGLPVHFPASTSVAVFLNSPGGSVVEAEKIARGLSVPGLPIAVLKNAECASACFLIFAAGTIKIASRSARIGVHSIADGRTGAETVAAKAMTTELARVCERLGVPPAIIGRMVTTPPGEVAWLSEPELESMGVRFVPLEQDD